MRDFLSYPSILAPWKRDVSRTINLYVMLDVYHGWRI